MSKYFVIHSSDPYLLARLCTELQMDGYRHYSYDDDHDTKNPFNVMLRHKWLAVYESMEISFYSHKCGGKPIRLTLTEETYTSVLNQIVKQ